MAPGQWLLPSLGTVASSILNALCVFCLFGRQVSGTGSLSPLPSPPHHLVHGRDSRKSCCLTGRSEEHLGSISSILLLHLEESMHYCGKTLSPGQVCGHEAPCYHRNPTVSKTESSHLHGVSIPGTNQTARDQAGILALSYHVLVTSHVDMGLIFL